MKVKDCMNQQVFTIKIEQTLAEAINLMVKNKTNSLIVVDNSNQPIGIVSSCILIQAIIPEPMRDNESVSQFSSEGVLGKYVKDAANKIVLDIMSKDFHCLSPDDAMMEAATYMAKDGRRILPVVDQDKKLVGAVTRTHIKDFFYQALNNN